MLSIIIPVYNVERYLPMCLESVVQQHLSDYEVILVDDGSTDISGTICDEYVEKHLEFKVIHKQNQGVAAARNTGIREATGEYIMFLDSDDFLVPNAITPLLEIAEKNNLDVLGFAYVTVPENIINAPQTDQFKSQNIEVFNGVDYIARHNYTAQVWWYIVRRKVIIDNGLFLPVGHVLEEAAFNLRLFMSAKRLAQVENIVYCYRERSTSIMHMTSSEHMTRMLDDYIYAASSINDVLDEYGEKINGDCHERCRTRRDSYVLFGAIKAFKLGKVKEYISKAREHELYPFKKLDEKDYPGVKFKVLHWCITKPLLWRAMSSVFKLFN